MGNVPPFIVITVLLGLVIAFLNLVFRLFEWLKVEPADVKKFLVFQGRTLAIRGRTLAIRGRTFAWNAYLIFAVLISIYFLFVFSIMLSYVSFSFSLATLILFILWGLLGTWAPAIQRLRSKRINTAVNIVAICLSTLMVVGFWIVKWPDIQQPIFVTLLLLVIVVIYIVDRAVKKRKPSHN